MATRDTEVGGCPVAQGDWVMMAFNAANRDPDVFERADEVLLDRQHNRHLGFGLGVHRCLGSNLARLEMNIAIEAWLARYPEFTLSDASARHLVGRPGPRPPPHPRPPRLTRATPRPRLGRPGRPGPHSRSGSQLPAICTAYGAERRQLSAAESGARRGEGRWAGWTARWRS